MADLIVSDEGFGELGSALTRARLASDPLVQFRVWFDEVQAAGVPEPEAMTLSSATADGAPSSRTVLLRGYQGDAPLFFTNYESRKGRELEVNPRACLLFYWRSAELGKRQVRIEGHARRAREETTERYFASRPFESQIGAWASPQSEVIANRRMLEERVLEFAEDFEDSDEVPVPPHWGGYVLEPTAFEFWQGRAHRLHDRFRYTHVADAWDIQRLAP